jgi:histidinol-phosphate aminotransferase
VFLANPNAQTGIYLQPNEVEKIVSSNPDRVVVVDEAYIDFGGVSVVPLTKRYKNLVVVQTFSKSRSLAGARVGFAIADESLIEDLNRVKFSFNPYNVNRLSALLAAEAIKDCDYFNSCMRRIIATREKLVGNLQTLGFSVLPSKANFVLAKSNKIGGEELYKKLKDKNILVRHFSDRRICDYVRITVGSDIQIDFLIKTIKEILGE